MTRSDRVLLALAGLLVAALLMACAIGAVPVPIFSAMLTSETLSDLHRTVLTELRVPRVALAATVGASLAMAGASLQGLFRNPLAEPQLIGVSAGAALGARGESGGRVGPIRHVLARHHAIVLVLQPVAVEEHSACEVKRSESDGGRRVGG